MPFVFFATVNGENRHVIGKNVTHAVTSNSERFLYTTLDWMYVTVWSCVPPVWEEGLCLHAVDLNWDHWPICVLNQRIWFKVMEWGLEVGRALWLGSHRELWKTVTRRQPNTWHPWSANHCLNFLASKATSFLSLFGVTLQVWLGDLELTWNNKIFDWLSLFSTKLHLWCSFPSKRTR